MIFQRKEIWLQMSGRLGNQLFQWAYAHKMAKHFNVKVTPVFDAIHEHKNYDCNIYEFLNSCDHINPARRINSAGILLAAIDKLSSKNPRISTALCRALGIFRVREFDSIPELPKTPPRLVTGFFINYKSVTGITTVLASELISGLSKIELPIQDADIYQVIHIRRGDFQSLRETFGVLSSDYYVQHMKENMATYICTDDENLLPEIVSIVNPKKIFGPHDLDPLQVLKLMSQATYLVMSNSTLSWWGGFLCLKNSGSVKIPSPFYRNSEKIFTSLNLPDFELAQSIFEA